jgi:uncharacterized protein (TIGR02687 family)
MKAEQVDKALHQKFITDGARLVFWHDTDAEFADYVAEGLAGELSDVHVFDVAQVGGLSAKLQLEREDRSGKYLVYSNGDRPPAEQDWLLDIRLYSVEFHADVASIWLQELGLGGLYLRDYLRARDAFLGNQERRRKLQRFISASDDQAAIDMKMMAVLVDSEVASPFEVLRALCHGHLLDDRFDLDEPPEVITTFGKMALIDRFWAVMRQEFGYAEDTPSVAGLLRRLFVSELFQQMGGARIDSLAHFELPAAGRRNAVVCLTQWRDSSGHAGSYDAAAAAVGAELRVGEQLSDISLDTLERVYTFWEAEKRVASGLKQRVLDETQTVDVEAVAAIAGDRQAGHWLAGPGCDLPERQAIDDAYDAIVAAAGLFALRREHQQTLKFETPEDLLTAYRDELHHFDRLYRDYCTKARPSQGQGWDLLKDLAEEVERVYGQGFLEPLGQEWSRLLDGGFLEQWSLKDLRPQQDFYARTIRPHVSGTVPKRAFVIISDALRYEAAQELTDELNGRYRMNAEISGMLGVLPSYTALGMASLLPHKTMAYSDKGDVLVDGRSVAGTEARNKQLATVGGIACQANMLLAMKRVDARTFIDGKRVIYIYHNVIDARGDSASTEEETFDAVSDCINELLELVQFCVNTLNAAKVWVSADHGFLFQQVAPDLTDKSKLDYVPPNAATKKKRYVIGRDLGSEKRAHHGSIEVTAGAGGGMEFWVPRAANRFHFTGGARFVHGGAMPQEVIVPLVAVTHLRGKRKEGTRIEKVSVQVLGDKHKITTPVHRFEIIQTTAVGERRKPITLRAAVYDGGQPVTSVETVTFDSMSDSLAARTKSIQVKLRTGTYDKAKPYQLVLRDVESEAEVQSVSVVIDRSFDDDF